MEREMLKQGSQEAATREHSHPPAPITVSQAQAMVITITLVPKPHTLLPRHFTHGMALLALLVQGGSGGLIGSHITMCLALLQADLWRRSSAGAFCSPLLLQSVVPPSQLPGFLTKAPRYTEHEIMSPWLVAGNMGLQLTAFLHTAPSGPHAPTQGPTHWQSEIPGKHSPHISITFSTQTGSSWPVWHPPTFSLEKFCVWCNVTLRAVLLLLRRRERNALDL